MKGRNTKLTALCMKRAHQLFKELGLMRPMLIHIPSSHPIEEDKYEEFAQRMATFAAFKAIEFDIKKEFERIYQELGNSLNE